MTLAGRWYVQRQSGLLPPFGITKRILVAPIETLTPSDFDGAMLEIFGTATRAALTALPGMRARRGGTIVFITSIGAKLGVPHLASYSAAKFAEAGFAEALAAEVAKDGVHVLSVFPGLMRTGSWLHASFRGAASRELRWFGTGAITPLLSIDFHQRAEMKRSATASEIRA